MLPQHADAGHRTSWTETYPEHQKFPDSQPTASAAGCFLFRLPHARKSGAGYFPCQSGCPAIQRRGRQLFLVNTGGVQSVSLKIWYTGIADFAIIVSQNPLLRRTGPKIDVYKRQGREGCSGCEAKRPVPFGIVFIQNNAENSCCVSQK